MWFACPCLAPLSQNSVQASGAPQGRGVPQPLLQHASSSILTGGCGRVGSSLVCFASVLLCYAPLLTLESGRITTGFKKESSKGGSGPLNSPLRVPSFCRILLEALGDGQMKKSGPTLHCAVNGVFCSLRPKQWSWWVGVGWGGEEVKQGRKRKKG